jgi:hypothetical protein
MATIEVAKVGALLAVLASHGRAPEIPEAADAYGWLIGSWNWMSTVIGKGRVRPPHQG